MRYETDMRGSRGRISEGQADAWLVTSGIVTTLMLHGVLVTLVVLGTMWSDASMKDQIEPKKIEFQEAELLALGEEKPKKQLPRIANPPKPSPDQETVALDQKKKPEPEKEPEQQTPEKTETPPDDKPSDEPSEDRTEEMNEAFKNLHNPNRPTNDEVPEGSEKGVAAGTISDEALASLMQSYRTKLLRAIGDRWQVPSTISDEELKKLYGQAAVYVRLSKDGEVVTFRFLRKTSNSQFNNSIRRLLRKFQASGGGHTLPMPSSPKLRTAILRKGLQLQNWEAAAR